MYRSFSIAIFCFVLFATLGVTSPKRASAQAGVRIHEIASDGIKVDGMLRDWKGLRFATLPDSDDDAGLKYALGYDRKGLYVAARISDDRIIRTSSFGTKEDAVVITLAKGKKGSDLSLYAGIPGQSAGQVRVGSVNRAGRKIEKAKIMERSVRGGLELEAYIPWRAIPHAKKWEGMGAAIRLRDADQEIRPTIETLSSSPVSPKSLNRLPQLMPSGGTHGLLGSFLAEQQLTGARPKFDLKGNVMGLADKERVVLVDRYIFVAGPNFRGGDGYTYFALPIATSAGIVSARLRDVTGSGKKEILVRTEEENSLGSRRVFSIFGLRKGLIKRLFAAELKKTTSAGSISGSVSIQKRKRPPEITLAAGSAQGLSATTYRDQPQQGMQPLLTPWSDHRSRVFKWNGSSFALVRELENKNKPATPQTTTRTTARPATAQAKSPAALSAEAQLSSFRNRQGIASSTKTRFLTKANVAQTKDKELVAVVGTKLFVAGKSFQGGRYFFGDLPAERDSDISSVTCKDVTGDGRAEIFVRLHRMQGDVVRDLLVAYRFTREGFTRALMVEVGRTQGKRTIKNKVSIKRGSLTISPGKAKGFSAATWRWSHDPSSNIGPILLPWRDQKARYRLNGAQLTR